MKIAIVGYKGFLGSRLMKAFPEATGIGRGELDRLKEEKFDWVINCAMRYYGTHEEMYCDNIGVAHEIMKGFFIHRYKIIHFGSIMEGQEWNDYTIGKSAAWSLISFAGQGIYKIVLGDVYDPEDLSRDKFIDMILLGKIKLKMSSECDCCIYPVNYKVIIDRVKNIISGKNNYQYQTFTGYIPIDFPKKRFWGFFSSATKNNTFYLNDMFISDMNLMELGVENEK